MKNKSSSSTSKGNFYYGRCVALFFLLLIPSIALFAQNNSYNVDPGTHIVTNYEAKYQFPLFDIYDLDLQISRDFHYVNAILLININSEGGGRLIVYVTKKTIFTIRQCTYDDADSKWIILRLKLLNENGREIMASLDIRKSSNSVYSFQITNPEERTVARFYEYDNG